MKHAPNAEDAVLVTEKQEQEEHSNDEKNRNNDFLYQGHN